MHTFTKKQLLIGAGIIVFLLLVGIVGFVLKQAYEEAQPFDAQALLAQLQQEEGPGIFLTLESSITDIMREHGLEAGFELIDEAENEGLITNDQCHALLHYVGHEGYAEYPYQYEYLTSLVEGTSCIGGFIHGIEAEIVLTSANMKEDLWDLCQYTIDAQVRPGSCYHGVGHAGAELYDYDIEKTLAMCDSLVGGPEDDLSNCYRGTFSELGNIIVGVDGHTGLPIESIGVDGLDPVNPYPYCQTFAERHQSSCKSQLTKLPLSLVPIEEWLDVCARPSLDTESRKICVNIASGVYVRETLSFQESTKLPDTINTLSAELREIALLGSLEAYSGYFTDNDATNKDWRPFCEDSFSRESDTQQCLKSFTEMMEEGRAQWMERTDIR